MKNSHLLLVILCTAGAGLLVGHLASDRQQTATTDELRGIAAEHDCDSATGECPGGRHDCTMGNCPSAAQPIAFPALSQEDPSAPAPAAQAAPRQGAAQGQRIQPAPQGPPSAVQGETRAQIPTGPQDPSLGPANARITLVEFSDFRCGFCGRLSPTIKELLNAYPRDLRVVFKHFPRNPQSDAFMAHMAAQEAQAQGKFWAFKDMLFAHRGPFTQESLVQLAQSAGLDAAAMQRALSGESHRALIEAHIAQGRAAGVRGTPASFINGRLVSGAQPVDAFKKVIDEELRR